MTILKNEKIRVTLFFVVLTIILTWPVAFHFFSSVPSFGSDTMQAIGVTGNKANIISDQGFFRGTWQLVKSSEFNVTAIYAYFQLIFGRIAAYNLLFFLSFILSGLGAYLLADYFLKNKPAALIAGIIFAFSPFHVHNSLSTNVGTMHQEWLPFFALYLFKFFDPVRNKHNESKDLNEKQNSQLTAVSNGVENLSLKNFSLAGLFLILIGLAEHQLLAFTVIFILFFLIYKAIAEPKIFLRGKLWLYIGISAVFLSIIFFFMFHSLFTIAGSSHNYLDAGLRSAVKYSNDSLSIVVTPPFHSFWPKAFNNLRGQFERRSSSTFSVFAGYSVLLFSLIGIISWFWARRKKMPTKGIFFWLAVAIGFYVLSWGPYLHYKGLLDPPVKMPYYLVYQYLPFYKNIRTVGRLFVFSMLGFSLLAAWGMTYLEFKILNFKFKIWKRKVKEGNETVNLDTNEKYKKPSTIVYSFIGLIIILEFLAVPLKTDSLLHSSFYEKLGQDKEQYSVLEIPGSTDYDFASRDLVWKSIHQKNTINGYDFARVNKEGYQFQMDTPIIKSLLYDIPTGATGNDSDIMKNSYYDISNEILNYYNIRWIILDKQGLKGNFEKGDPDMFYPTKAYIASVIKCANEYTDTYLYACEIDRAEIPAHMFLAMDYSNPHWIGKSNTKTGIQRFAENGAGIKLINMTSQIQKSKLNFNVKISKPLRIKVFLNETEIFNQYITTLGQKQSVSADLPGMQKNWCATAGLTDAIMVSDCFDMAVGKAYGTYIRDVRLDQRAVIVVDAGGVVRHAEYCPEISMHPDYEAALAAVKAAL